MADQISPSAERAAERIQWLYTMLEPRLGVHLTDPNVILTLADARGQTEFSIPNANRSDEKAFTQLNSLCLDVGLRFWTMNIEPLEYHNRTSLMMSVDSLVGYEITSRLTNLPGFSTFDRYTGWKGLDEWLYSAKANLMAAQAEGSYPREVPPDQLIHVLRGVIKGYPDEAVLASMWHHLTGLQRLERGECLTICHTSVPYSTYYPCAQPNYSYDPKDQAVIDKHTATWGSILQQYYCSDTHKRLEADENFRTARG